MINSADVQFVIGTVAVCVIAFSTISILFVPKFISIFVGNDEMFKANSNGTVINQTTYNTVRTPVSHFAVSDPSSKSAAYSTGVTH